MSRHQFHCPSCGADVVVDDRVRRYVLDDGCLLCLAPVTDDAFEMVAEAES
ncbi:MULTISPECIES: hypothetical protein [Haloferax]|uniref:DUF7560 family zinc ribbon protein n=1 Tax=Haloferax TaxID=2251 RepID=UPI00177AB5F8|nr:MULTISPECIES: hypothetical protein [Haloferax]